VGNQPWVLHLSYVKPHWPYMAPAPYHAMHSAEQCLPVVRSDAELNNAHPVLAAYRQQEECVSFQNDDCIRIVRPVYQGLIAQLDHHLGRLFEAMAASGRLDDTLIVLCSDHGDFLGDHWLGEKELFYDTVQRVPFIVVDPRRDADATRGTVEPRLSNAWTLCPRSSTRWASIRARTAIASRAAACSRCFTGRRWRPNHRGATSSSASSTTAFGKPGC
jgi:arylsulfatase A-like enzyme